MAAFRRATIDAIFGTKQFLRAGEDDDKIEQLFDAHCSDLEMMKHLTMRRVLTFPKFNKVLKKQKTTVVNFRMKKIPMTSLSLWFMKNYPPNGYLLPAD
ncbi:hypothetical protein JTB14_000215 [Gonioctena quinquepunctata]|nr:hypothetical protein JTB14_000215 [Gonioctena quinquepunctata]